jgi:hypothetical protein
MWKARLCGGIAMTICLTLTTLCLWPVITSKNFGKRLGKDIPTAPPDESNRVIHPDGFSIVLPPDWEVRLSSFAPAINSWPRRTLPSRHSAGITIMRVAESQKGDSHVPPNAAGITFLGEAAFASLELKDGSWPDDPDRSSFRIDFEHKGHWYWISYHIAEKRSELPKSVRLYFDTFRIEPRSATER